MYSNFEYTYHASKQFLKVLQHDYFRNINCFKNFNEIHDWKTDNIDNLIINQLNYWNSLCFSVYIFNVHVRI